MLTMLRAELELAMALVGVRTGRDVSRELLAG